MRLQRHIAYERERERKIVNEDTKNETEASRINVCKYNNRQPKQTFRLGFFLLFLAALSSHIDQHNKIILRATSFGRPNSEKKTCTRKRIQQNYGRKREKRSNSILHTPKHTNSQTHNHILDGNEKTFLFSSFGRFFQFFIRTVRCVWCAWFV